VTLATRRVPTPADPDSDERISHVTLTSTKTRVVIYVRISQDILGEHLGVERQLKECREWADRQGYDVAAVVEDNDVSATKGLRRDGFERILAGEFGDTPLLVWHPDRLVRVTKDLERVIERGLTVYAVHAGHVDLSNPAGRAVARTVTAWATYEGEQKSLRQKASHRQRAEQGKPFLGGARPFGYDKDQANHTYQIRADEAEVLREAYRRLLAGSTLAGIARYMNTNELPGTGGALWKQPAVRNLLIQPRNAGILTYNKQEAGVGNWKPIVSMEVYRAAMSILGSPLAAPPARVSVPGSSSICSSASWSARCAAAGPERCTGRARTGGTGCTSAGGAAPRCAPSGWRTGSLR
jgi:site-specific DNA recombinase